MSDEIEALRAEIAALREELSRRRPLREATEEEEARCLAVLDAGGVGPVPARWVEALRLRVGGMNLREVGEALAVSRERARQMVGSACARVRSYERVRDSKNAVVSSGDGEAPFAPTRETPIWIYAEHLHVAGRLQLRTVNTIKNHCPLNETVGEFTRRLARDTDEHPLRWRQYGARGHSQMLSALKADGLMRPRTKEVALAELARELSLPSDADR